MKRKRITDMDMVEINNFQRECKNYIIDNEPYIRELYESFKSDGIRTTDLVKCTLQHYDATVEAWNDSEGKLTNCQRRVLKWVAKDYFTKEKK